MIICTSSLSLCRRVGARALGQRGLGHCSSSTLLCDGGNSWLGASSLRLNSLPVCDFPVKGILQLTFTKGINRAASQTTTEASTVSTVLNCKPVDTLAEQEGRTSAHTGPRGPAPLLHSLVQAASSQLLPTGLQLVSSGISYFMMGEEKKSCLVTPLSALYTHSFATDESMDRFSTA